MTAAHLRISASPYARRLAQSRSIPLGLLSGTGPAGRIVAADVFSFKPASDEVPQEPLATCAEVPLQTSRTRPGSPRSAFSSAISPNALYALIANVGTTGFALDLEDLALRASTYALTIAGLPGASVIAFESGERRILVDIDLRLSIGHNRKARLAAIDGLSEDTEGRAFLSLQVVAATRVTSLLISLPPGQAMRLRLSVGAEGNSLSALLCTDPEAIHDEMAVAFLSAFSEALEQPLALLA
jgi:hypothetical protein